MKQIIFGVCGIGNGHTFRQLPLIEHFAKNCKLVIFAYGESLKFYASYFAGATNIKVIKVSVPYLVCNDNEIDFEETAKRIHLNNPDYIRINSEALQEAYTFLPSVNLVISDYEPISAQFAYSHAVPLVTIDQQSKYLCGDFPPILESKGYEDEIAKLRFFFPKADSRIACSFFKTENTALGEKIHEFPSTIPESIKKINRSNISNDILVYLSSQASQPIDELIHVMKEFPDYRFHIFSTLEHQKSNDKNLIYYTHGDKKFQQILSSCAGIISTAGHSLLSEAMFLGIPVFCLPIPIYEQHMSARVIDENNFGISRLCIDYQNLNEFLEKIPFYSENIKNDSQVLFKTSGEKEIIDFLENILECK